MAQSFALLRRTFLATGLATAGLFAYSLTRRKTAWVPREQPLTLTFQVLPADEARDS